MVTKEQFDTAQSAYFAMVSALVLKLLGHPAAADFTDELDALNKAGTDLTALGGDSGSQAAATTGSPPA